MKPWAVGVLAAVCLVAAPVAVAATPPDLAARIKAIYDAEPPVDSKAFIAQAEPLMQEARAVPGLDIDDFSRISLIYALSLYNDGRVAEAREIVKTAIERVDAEGGGDANRFMSNLLTNYAVYQTQSGDPEAGLATQKRALALAQKQHGDDSTEVGAIYGTMASSSSLLGRQHDTLMYYRMSIERMDPEVDSATSYVANLGNLAGNLRQAGEYDEALKYSRMNIDAAGKYLPEGHRALGYALFNAGEIMMALGRYGEAEALFRQAQAFGQKYRGKTAYDTAVFTYGLGRSLVAHGRIDEAEALMFEALAMAEAAKSNAAPDLPGMIRMSLGAISADRGDLDEAITREMKAIEVLTPLGPRGDSTRARAQIYLGQYLLLKGDPAAALAQVEPALDYYRREFPMTSQFRISAESLHALILSRLGRTTEALDEAQVVSDAVVASLDKGSARGSQAGLIQAYQSAFVRYTDIALAAGRPDLAFAGAQRAAHSEIAATSQALAVRAAAADPKAADLARQLQDAQVTRLRLERERNFARGKSKSETARLDGELVTAEASLAAITGQLDQAFPDFDRLSHPAPQTVVAAQAALPPDHAIVMPLTSDDRLIVLVVTRKGLTWDATPLDRLSAARDIDAIRRSVDSALSPAGGADTTGFDRAPAWRLGNAIFTPKVQAALKTAKELDIVGSGALMSLPLGLLLTQAPQGSDSDPRVLRDSAWLIKSYAISVKPALVEASPLLRDGPRGFLGIGAPVLAPAGSEAAFETASLYRGGGDKDTLADVEALRRLPSLPHAEGELQRMRNALALPNSSLMVGAEATETRIKQASLENYSVIAFATHGLAGGNLQTLREPALVLTPPDQPSDSDDGLLTASDVAGLRLRARWVILSACNSGTGREAGASYSGLAKAFMQAGADSLLVSMWPVRDDVADRLSVDTVKHHAEGDSQAQALRHAVLDLMKDTRVDGGANPAIWAPFSLVVR